MLDYCTLAWNARTVDLDVGATKLEPPTSRVEDLRKKVGCEWPSIRKARQRTAAHLEKIRAALARDEKLDSEDRSIVAFGSIARDECTSGSDLDWTLLIDGWADPEHIRIAQAITTRLEEAEIRPPSPAGAFANLTFSHELIHQIGGEDDTNRNTTQRILLLLESRVIGRDHIAYNRVVKGVLNRYLEEDLSFLTSASYKVPRFLLNDIVRFWRTMAVDFASKQRERGGKGWALRHVKLRMSRKLIFASGLLMCFGCHLRASLETSEFRPGDPVHPFVNHLKEFIGRPPLETVADAFLSYDGSHDTARKLFNAYDAFLGLLDDETKRKELDNLKPIDAQENPIFQQARETSHRFQEALTDLFYDHSNLSELMKIYGVF